jgi:hypothetical protein
MLMFVAAMLLLWLLFGCAEDFTGKNTNRITIDSIAPKAGYTGETFRIYGKGFSAIADSNKIYINGIAATPEDPASLSTLLVTIPEDATTGNIALEAFGEKATGPILTVFNRPLIQQVAEVSYQQLILTGKYFSTDVKHVKVFYTGKEVAINSTTKLPDGRPQLNTRFIDSKEDNPVSIVIESDGVRSNPFVYAVTPILKDISNYKDSDEKYTYLAFYGAYFGLDKEGNEIILKENGKIVTPEMRIEHWESGTILVAIVLKTSQENTLQVKIKDKLSEPITLRY